MTNPQHEFNFITVQKKVDRVDTTSPQWKKLKVEVLSIFNIWVELFVYTFNYILYSNIHIFKNRGS